MTKLAQNIAILYNDYMESYNNLLKKLKESELSILKSMLNFRLTERDEIKFALFENKRLSMCCVNIVNVGTEEEEIKLDAKFCPKKKTCALSEKKDSVDMEEKNSKDGLHNRHNKYKSTKTIIEVEEKDELKVINPIKFIHGGFSPSSFRNCQHDLDILMVEVVNVINKKRKILKLLNEYEEKGVKIKT